MKSIEGGKKQCLDEWVNEASCIEQLEQKKFYIRTSLVTIYHQVRVCVCFFRLAKKLEHSWKALVHDGVRTLTSTSQFGCNDLTIQILTCFISFFQDTVSVHRPGFYAERFQKFMCNTVFRKNACKFMLSPSEHDSVTPVLLHRLKVSLSRIQ